jgi:transposase
MSHSEVADKLGCSRRTVQNWMDRHNIESREPGPPRSGPNELHDESFLREQYLEERLTAAEIAEKVGCHENSILRRLREIGIETRNRGTRCTRPELNDADSLRRMHHDDWMDTISIAEELGCDPKTVRRRLREFDIEIRSPRREDYGLDAETLVEEYVESGKSATEIASDVDCAVRTVLSRLREYNIPVRPPTEDVPCELDDPEELQRLYEGERLTVKAIAYEFDCHESTVYQRLEEHGIERRRPGTQLSQTAEVMLTDAEYLEREFEERGKSAYKIAEQLECSPGTVRNWLRRYDIIEGEVTHTWGSKYGPNWPGQRAKRLQIDDDTCQRCDMGGVEHVKEHGHWLEVHHIDPFDPDGEHESQNCVGNLITLCHNCHTTMQGLPIDNRSTGDE